MVALLLDYMVILVVVFALCLGSLATLDLLRDVLRGKVNVTKRRTTRVLRIVVDPAAAPALEGGPTPPHDSTAMMHPGEAQALHRRSA
jgi:hypothetical protein